MTARRAATWTTTACLRCSKPLGSRSTSCSGLPSPFQLLRPPSRHDGRDIQPGQWHGAQLRGRDLATCATIAGHDNHRKLTYFRMLKRLLTCNQIICCKTFQKSAIVINYFVVHCKLVSNTHDILKYTACVNNYQVTLNALNVHRTCDN